MTYVPDHLTMAAELVEKVRHHLRELTRQAERAEDPVARDRIRRARRAARTVASHIEAVDEHLSNEACVNYRRQAAATTDVNRREDG